MGANERAALLAGLQASRPPGCLLLETCHRVELYGPAQVVEAALPGHTPAGSRELRGSAAARHLLSVAVGRESAVVAEDQLLHQLRLAAKRARAAGPLPLELDRLIDLALRAGRQARSWLPARRASLAELALDRVLGAQESSHREPSGAGKVLLVGAGEMGRRAARALAGRGAALIVASRTPERAAALAGAHAGRQVAFDPGPAAMRQLAGIVVALAGRWPASAATYDALLDSKAWLVDLSAPSALPPDVAVRLGPRLLAIDELAAGAGSAEPSAELIERLDRLIERTLADYRAWSLTGDQRSAARALSQRAHDAQAHELEELWRRMPRLAADQRQEVERMARQLTERLLRDPLERLHEDQDGRRARAARELFRL